MRSKAKSVKSRRSLRILNLGAGGFIGSHLTRRLLAAGHAVVGVDTHKDKLQDALGRRGFRFVAKDIRSRRFDLEGLVRGSDLVIDLIAHANPGLYVRQPLEVFRLNFTENLRIAELCVRHGKRLIQFSSCEVYGKTPVASLRGKLPNPGNPAYATFAEDQSDFILGPVARHRWIYACAKQLLERVLHAYGLAGRLNYTIIRPFNFIGPKIDYLPAEADGVPRVFSFFMEALLTGQPMKLVDGGHHQRCYCYIDDAVEACCRIAANPRGVCDRQIFNLGAPRNETTIQGLAELMREIYGRKFLKPGRTLPPIVAVSAEEFYGAGYEDCDRRIPDVSKARDLLGWEPRTGLREALEKTMAYYVRTGARPRHAG